VARSSTSSQLLNGMSVYLLRSHSWIHAVHYCAVWDCTASDYCYVDKSLWDLGFSQHWKCQCWCLGVMPCVLTGTYRHFREIYCLCLQDGVPRVMTIPLITTIVHYTIPPGYTRLCPTLWPIFSVKRNKRHFILLR
jgi:hypothetical protein